MVSDLWTWLALSSDAVQVALAGACCWVVAGFCALMERRRGGARSPDALEKVGWMPWTTLFVCAAIIGGGCLAMSLPVVIGQL